MHFNGRARLTFASVFVAVLWAGLEWSFPQPSQAQPKPAAVPPAKGPVLPAVAPGQAKLDQTINGLGGPGLALACNEAAGAIAAGCEDGTIQYWNKGVLMGFRVGDRTPNVVHAHQGPVLALAWCGGVLASVGGDGKVALWSMPEGKVIQAPAVAPGTRALALSPDGKTLATAGEDPTIQLWDAATGKAGAKLSGHTDWVLCLAFSADGTQLASGGYDGTARLWDVASGKKLLDLPARSPPLANTPPAPDNIVSALAFSPDGKRLAVGGTDGLVRLFNTADGKAAGTLTGHAGTVTALAFHPGGALLASGSKDRTVKLWTVSPAVNAQPVKSLENHEAWVQGVAFFAQGTRLASVGADETARLWDLAAPK